MIRHGKSKYANCRLILLYSQFVTPTQASPIVSTLKTSCLLARASKARYNRSNMLQTFTGGNFLEMSVNPTMSLKNTVTISWFSLQNIRQWQWLARMCGSKQIVRSARVHLRFHLSTSLNLLGHFLWKHLVHLSFIISHHLSALLVLKDIDHQDPGKSAMLRTEDPRWE